MTREEEIFEASKKFSEYEYNQTNFENGFINGAKWADKHPANAWHDPSKEIKELIIHCVDKCAEHEMYPKDTFNEIYEYIDKWYKDENQNNWQIIFFNNNSFINLKKTWKILIKILYRKKKLMVLLLQV